MTVEGFSRLREEIRRAVRQLNSTPNDVFEMIESQVRVDHELLLDAWDEMRHRGAAVHRVAKSEYNRTRQLINEVLQPSTERKPPWLGAPAR